MGQPVLPPEDFDLNQHLTQAVDSLYARFTAEPDEEIEADEPEESNAEYEDARPEPKTSPMLCGTARSSSVKR